MKDEEIIDGAYKNMEELLLISLTALKNGMKEFWPKDRTDYDFYTIYLTTLAKELNSCAHSEMASEQADEVIKHFFGQHLSETAEFIIPLLNECKDQHKYWKERALKSEKQLLNPKQECSESHSEMSSSPHQPEQTGQIVMNWSQMDQTVENPQE